MSAPRRVLHLCDNRDGVAEGIAALSQAAGSDAWQPTVAVLGRLNERELLQAAGLEIVELAGRGHFDPLMLGRLAQLLRRERPAAIHAWGLPALMAAQLTRPRSGQMPLIATLDLRDSLPAWSGRLLRSLAPKLGSLVVADEPTQQWATNVTNAATQIQILPTPVMPLPEPTEARESALARWGFPPDARVIATAAPLEPIARFDEAIWCYELVRVIHPSARLLIVGTGSDGARLERFARQVSEPACVAIVPEIRTELAAAIVFADAYWQLGPSTAAPRGLLHAMRAGKPIVACDAAVHAAAAGSGETMMLTLQDSRAAAGRATDDFFNDPQLAAQWGTAAAQGAATRFDAATLAAQLQAIYDHAT